MGEGVTHGVYTPPGHSTATASQHELPQADVSGVITIAFQWMTPPT